VILIDPVPPRLLFIVRLREAKSVDQAEVSEPILSPTDIETLDVPKRTFEISPVIEESDLQIEASDLDEYKVP
jgi:hypothetical protein